MTNDYFVSSGLLVPEQSMNNLTSSNPKKVCHRIVIDVDSGSVRRQETEIVEITVHMTPARAKKVEENQQKLQDMVKGVLLDFAKSA
jgi:hypothetical protein